MVFEPYEDFLGGYSQNDGTVDFYGRVNSILKPEMTVLDLGSGRGAWFEDDKNVYRKSLRLLKGKVACVIAADVDKVVMENRSADRCLIIENGRIPILNSSVDIIVSDYVFEHVDNVNEFVAEVNRILKVGGYLCARTPHKWNYVSIAARMVKNSHHSAVLRRIQPDRKEVDVFPTVFKLNTLTDIRKNFDCYRSHSFIYRADPSYYFGNKLVYKLLSFAHRLMPSFFCGNLFVFIRKN